MKINHPILSISVISLLKENLLPVLTPHQKQILIIAGAAFGFLAACYLLRRCRFKEKTMKVEGQMIKGQLNGPSKKILSDGTVCQGHFKDGLLHDSGKMIYPDGTVWEGKFKDGNLNGAGMISFSSGEKQKVRFAGNFFKGQGKIIYPKQFTCEGKFKNGKLNGEGKVTAHNGISWVGEFKEGEFIGGVRISKDGEVVEKCHAIELD